MDAKPFDSEASLGERRIILRRSGEGVEMLELPWGLEPFEAGGRSVTVLRGEGRTFSSHRCLVPASVFRHRSRGKNYSFSLADGNWFYFAGVWRPATRSWPESYAILTIAANDDVAPFHDRQMAVVPREERMAWLDLICPEDELLRPLPAGSFKVSSHLDGRRQAAFAF